MSRSREISPAQPVSFFGSLLVAGLADLLEAAGGHGAGGQAELAAVGGHVGRGVRVVVGVHDRDGLPGAAVGRQLVRRAQVGGAVAGGRGVRGHAQGADVLRDVVHVQRVAGGHAGGGGVAGPGPRGSGGLAVVPTAAWRGGAGGVRGGGHGCRGDAENGCRGQGYRGAAVRRAQDGIASFCLLIEGVGSPCASAIGPGTSVGSPDRTRRLEVAPPRGGSATETS